MSISPSCFDHKTLMALVEASKALISEPRLAAVLQQVAEQAAFVLSAEGASVLLLDTSRHELVFEAATGPKGNQLVGERFSADLGIAGQAVKTRRAARVDDVSSNRNFFAGVDAKTQMHTRSLLVAPLIHLEEILGVVEVLNPIGREAFSDRDLELLQVFANLAAAALQSGKAFDRVTRDNLGWRESMPAPRIIGRSKAMQKVMQLVRKAAPSTLTVLLHGETGTGKELAARAIHDFSERRNKPFIAINCAALPETLLESELFGYEKGAFTGAIERKLGRFELADGGTLFLDEVGEMNQSIQVKLLRVIQEREFVRVGGTQTITCDVRIVAATNRDLKAEMQSGRFREDLFYRLNVFPIILPPLRERIDDLPALVEHFMRQVAPSLVGGPNRSEPQMGTPITAPHVTDDALTALMSYPWPGNIRELRNVIERATLLCENERITLDNLPPEVSGERTASITNPQDPQVSGMSRLANQERGIILKVLGDCGWNQSAAARALGVSRDILRYRIKKYGLRQS